MHVSLSCVLDEESNPPAEKCPASWLSESLTCTAADSVAAADVAERLISHLQNKTDVQNIDLMNLSGFCRNCLSKWYKEEADKKGIEISDLDAREHVYGMPYSEWKEKYQK